MLFDKYNKSSDSKQILFNIDECYTICRILHVYMDIDTTEYIKHNIDRVNDKIKFNKHVYQLAENVSQKLKLQNKEKSTEPENIEEYINYLRQHSNRVTLNIIRWLKCQSPDIVRIFYLSECVENQLSIINRTTISNQPTKEQKISYLLRIDSLNNVPQDKLRTLEYLLGLEDDRINDLYNEKLSIDKRSKDVNDYQLETQEEIDNEKYRESLFTKADSVYQTILPSLELDDLLEPEVLEEAYDEVFQEWKNSFAELVDNHAYYNEDDDLDSNIELVDKSIKTKVKTNKNDNTDDSSDTYYDTMDADDHYIKTSIEGFLMGLGLSSEEIEYFQLSYYEDDIETMQALHTIILDIDKVMSLKITDNLMLYLADDQFKGLKFNHERGKCNILQKVLDSDLNFMQMKFLATNINALAPSKKILFGLKKKTDTSVLFKLFNQSNIEISTTIDKVLLLFHSLYSANILGNNRSELNMKGDEICYKLFMTQKEKAKVDASGCLVGEYINIVPKAFKRFQAALNNIE